ncbi:C4-dicarboxylate TRAP transporter substrate-binding protein [Tateyamaria sp.]|uniref:C4-dicarboxylate TRAP transporter substrate-binding protein n=1 Tax=Tateyamaria sp. TaxID=1929288 RepID=UPI003B224DB4
MLTAVAALTASTALADNFTFRIGSGHPNGPAAYVSDMADFFVPEVKKRAEAAGHTVDFVEGYGGAIAGVAETLESVQNGILDVGGYCMCFEPAKLFLHNFPYYVPFGPQDSSNAMTAARATYDAVPWLTEQFSSEYGQVLLGLHGWDNYHLGMTDPWETVDDLKGIKIGGAGPNLPWIEFAGGVPVQSTLPDGYLSLQTGVYNGWLMLPSAYFGFKFHEPAPYYTLVGFGAMPVNALTMNKRKFDSLPEDMQKIMMEVGAEYEAQAGAKLNGRQAWGLNGLKEAGATITELPADVRAAWAQSLSEFPGKQAAEANGRNMPGSEVLNAYLKAIEASGYEMPVAYTVE